MTNIKKIKAWFALYFEGKKGRAHHKRIYCILFHMLTEEQTDKQQPVCRKATRLYRETEPFSSVQSVFITEETVNKL